MNIEEVEVTIGPDGNVEVRVHGMQGDGCLELTRELEALLGEVQTRERTDGAVVVAETRTSVHVRTEE